MTKFLKPTLLLALALSLSACFYGGRPYHRHWHAPYRGYPGYWR